MKQKALLALLLSIGLFQTNINLNTNYNCFANLSGNKTIIEEKAEALRNFNRKKDKNQKKDLKREMRRRKLYHKSLLSLYNKNFENKYLKLIESNSIKINKLREYILKI